MTDISGFGLQINIVASVSFPQGFVIQQFAGDADPFDMPSMQIADSEMGVNGHLATWSKANPIKPTINVIPGSEDDQNLQVLFEQNRPGRGKFPAGDVITMTGVYADGTTITLTNGKITDGMPGKSLASAGRLKTKAYIFAFENQVIS